jgi:hypothetical protein
MNTLAYNIARSQGASVEDAEDFSQYLELQRLRGVVIEPIKLRWIDFLRERDSRIDSVPYKSKCLGVFLPRESDNFYMFDEFAGDFYRMLYKSELEEDDIVIAIMYYENGYTAEEISKCFTCNYQIIYRKIRNIKTEVLKCLNNERKQRCS